MKSWISNRLRYETSRVRSRYRHRHGHPYSPVLPARKVRQILNRHDLGFQPDGAPTWWYASFEQLRNEEDDLTKAALRYATEVVPTDARILITGCGTGWMLVWLGQHGFRNLEGFDYLPNVVAAAKEIADLAGLETKLWQDDGFSPTLAGQYDLVLALHWVYSAWMGNYGNKPRTNEDREQLLGALLEAYADHVESGGLLMLELIDAISDLLDPPSDLYPIRHSLDQVERSAASAGFRIEKRAFNSRYGHLPRMLYWLRRT